MKKGHGNNLSRKQELAIAALLNCKTVKAAAVKAGITDRTLRTWLTRPAFLAAYRAARRAIVEIAVARLQRATGKAVRTLTRNLTCGKASDEIRAALGILHHSLRAVEVTDLAEQLEDLKRQLEGLQHEPGNNQFNDRWRN